MDHNIYVGKFGAVFASIPAPIVAALYCLFFAYVGMYYQFKEVGVFNIDISFKVLFAYFFLFLFLFYVDTTQVLQVLASFNFAI